MKKVSIIILSLMLLSKVSMAQEGFKLGLKVNPIVSFVTITDSNKTKITDLTSKARLGYAFGLMINYGFTETIGLHTGIHIVNKGYRGTEILTDPIGSTHTKSFNQSMMAVEVPIALKLRSPDIASSGIHITGLFGVVPEINISNRYDTQGMFVISSDTTTGAMTYGIQDLPTTRKPERLNMFTLSFLVGIGVDWEFDWGMISMGPSFHMGLLDLLRRKHDDNMMRHSKLSYVALDLGYYF